MDVYIDGLADSKSEASAHLAKVSRKVARLEVNDPDYLKENYAIDKVYFDLKKITPKKNKSKKLTQKAIL